MLIPSNIKPDKYLGKGYWFLGLFIIFLLIFIISGAYSFFYEGSDNQDAISFLSVAITGLTSILLALFTFLAFYVQYDANKKIQAQNLELQQQIKEQSANEHFYKMLELHKENISEFSIKSFTSKFKSLKEIHVHGNLDATLKTVEADHFELTDQITHGRRCFILMLNDFHYCAQLSFLTRERLGFLLSDEITLMLAYRVFFWGSNSKHVYPPNLCRHQKIECQHIVFEINRLRIAQRANKETPVTFRYPTNDEEENIKSARFILASGHSSRLAHYYRQLYQTAKHIHNTSSFQDDEFLKNSDIDLRFKTLRAQMTNEEQLLLYYNYRYGFGGRWDYRFDDPAQGTSDFRFLTKYKMLHNIPLYDTMHASAQNPVEHFQEYKDKFPTADLFEWGGYN